MHHRVRALGRRRVSKARVSRWLILSIAWVGALAAAAAEPITSCEPVGPSRPVCGFKNPEDLAALPGDQALLVSEYRRPHDSEPGALALFVLATDERRVLFRDGDAKGGPSEGWGDPRCPGAPPAGFSPHGIDLAKRPDGKLSLAVVQHGGRESVELFEVSGVGTDWELVWRGCLVGPPDTRLNDVVLLSDGSLMVSHIRSQSESSTSIGSRRPGWVWRWAPGTGFSKVPGSEVLLANGFEVSPDEKTLFVNSSMGEGLRRVDLATGVVTGQVDFPVLDNTTWAPDGKLLVASLGAPDGGDFESCPEIDTGACATPFRIVAVDPVSLRTTVRFDSAGSPMGAGTVGLQIGHELFIGSFAADRILRVQLDGPFADE